MDKGRMRQGMRRYRHPLAVPAVLAVAAMGWFGYAWWDAEHDPDVSLAVQREQVLEAGQRAITTFSTLDHRSVDQGYGGWLDSSTGDLHDELAKDADAGKERIRQARTVTTGTVQDAAVTELDERGGTAKVIASVSVVVAPEQGEPVTKQNRFHASLSRTDGGWKISELGQVPVGQA